MLTSTSHLSLSRRVCVYYLLFCLGAIGWLAVGVAFVARSVVESRAESTWLTRLGEVAGDLPHELLDDSDSLQTFVKHHADQWNLEYCAVVTPDSRYLAHSSAERVGKRHKLREGQRSQWGDVARVRFISAGGDVLREYSVPLVADGEPRGTLVLGIPDPPVWSTVITAGESAPLVLLFPMLVIAVGALRLRRLVAPIGEIEAQLRQQPDDIKASTINLQPIEAAGPAEQHWNQLVEAVRERTRGDDLEARLDGALKGYRGQQSDQILNSLTDGIAVTDESGRITLANKSLLGLLSKATSDESLLGQTMEQCLGLNSTGKQARQLLDSDLKDRRVVVELSELAAMPRATYRVARSPKCGRDGASGAGHVWCIRDITQQKLADKMRNQFVSAATHELRTPLANIKAYSEALTLSEGIDIEQQKLFCNTIDDEVTRLAHFVDDLLNLNCMEVGSTALKQQVTDMERLLKETIGKVEGEMDKKNIAFEAKLPGKLPELMVDKDKLVVALVNLLGNAAKYTPEGGQVLFHVELSETAVLIHVEDTGIGIAENELSRVFDKFFRSDDERVHDINGSGLGLSLTHEIIRLHGGKLTVHSELNKGSKFTATLPLAAEVRE